jgi:PTS system nitrogen regulatory IIA component
MLLTVRDAAKLLGKSEQQIYRWVDDGEIPFHRVNEHIRFHRAELLEWATAKKLAVNVDIFQDAEDADQAVPALADALQAGGIHYQVEGSDRESVLRAVLSRMPLEDDADRDFLLDVLLAREAAGSTGIGDGIAIPHVRSPVVLDGAATLISLCFLDKPVEYGAIDGQPVHTIFSLVSPTIKGHLRMLAKLSAAMLDSRFRATIVRRAPAEEILAEARRVESTFLKTRGAN